MLSCITSSPWSSASILSHNCLTNLNGKIGISTDNPQIVKVPNKSISKSTSLYTGASVNRFFSINRNITNRTLIPSCNPVTV